MQSFSYTKGVAGIRSPERGQPLIGPTRDPVKHTGRCFRAKCYSPKNKRHIRCESLLEMRGMHLFEFPSGVTSYSEQPPALRLKIGRRFSRYTPDVVVHWASGAPWLVEIKPEEIANTPKMRAKFNAAGVAAIVRGYHFVVLTEKHIKHASLKGLDLHLEARRRPHVEALGQQAIMPAESPCSDLTRRVHKVLASALEASPSVRLARALHLLNPGVSAYEQLDYAPGPRRADWSTTRCISSRTQSQHIHGGQ